MTQLFFDFLLNIYSSLRMSISHRNTSLFRIGSVSKAAGIPVSTLRIWETRYGAFSPIKSDGNHRLFGDNDISKAILLKQLLTQGHSISTVAGLDTDQLRHIVQLSPALGNQTPFTLKPAELTIVGTNLANKLESAKDDVGWLKRNTRVVKVYPDVDALREAVQQIPSDILLIKTTTLQHSSAQVIKKFRERHPFAQTFVIYNFAPDAVVNTLKFDGCLVRRDPMTDSELSEWLQSVLFVDSTRAQEFGTSGSVINVRKYSDATLSRVAGISSNVLCECPKHVAELISQLASFEEYSQECLNNSAEDAHLHAYLRSIAGSARSLFENALEKIAQHEGIDLTEAQQ